MNTIKQNIVHDIDAYLSNKLEAMVKLLMDMAAIESPSGNKKALNNMVGFLSSKFKTLGYYTTYVNSKNTGGYFYIRPKERSKNKPLQLLIGHCDTVWQIDTLKNMPIVQQNNRLKGPGVYDMKAGLTQIIFALTVIKKLKLKLSVIPIILINTDEEVGSSGSTHIIKMLSKIVNRAYVLEPPLGLDGELKTARKGIGRFIITAKGKAAHAGLDPRKGANAIVELSHQIQKLYEMNDFEKGITINIGQIEGGISPNVVAAESKAIIDVRVYNHEDGIQITKRIHQLQPKSPDVTLKIEGAIGRPPMEKTFRNQKLWNLAKANAKLMGLNLGQATAGGGSDGNTTSLYTATLDGLGTTGDGAHATHEFIFTDKLVERTTLLTLLLMEASIK